MTGFSAMASNIDSFFTYAQPIDHIDRSFGIQHFSLLGRALFSDKAIDCLFPMIATIIQYSLFHLLFNIIFYVICSVCQIGVMCTYEALFYWLPRGYRILLWHQVVSWSHLILLFQWKFCDFNLVLRRSCHLYAEVSRWFAFYAVDRRHIHHIPHVRVCILHILVPL